MVKILYKSLFDGKSKFLDIETTNPEDILNEIREKEGIFASDLKIYSNGKIFSSLDGYENQDFIPLTLLLSLPGGKGGFGSLLRAIGAQIEKTTNREACRDLSGRRLRDINAEKRFKEWMQKREERQKEREKKRKEKLEKLKEEPKILFEDPNYFKNKDEIPTAVEDALKYGLEKMKSQRNSSAAATKRKSTSPEPVAAKKSKPDIWLGVELSDDDENDSVEGSVENGSPSNEKTDEVYLKASTSSSDPSTSQSSEDTGSQLNWAALASAALQAASDESTSNSESSSSDSSSDSSRSDKAPVEFPPDLFNHSSKSL